MFSRPPGILGAWTARKKRWREQSSLKRRSGRAVQGERNPKRIARVADR